MMSGSLKEFLGLLSGSVTIQSGRMCPLYRMGNCPQVGCTVSYCCGYPNALLLWSMSFLTNTQCARPGANALVKFARSRAYPSFVPVDRSFYRCRTFPKLDGAGVG